MDKKENAEEKLSEREQKLAAELEPFAVGVFMLMEELSIKLTNSREVFTTAYQILNLIKQKEENHTPAKNELFIKQAIDALDKAIYYLEYDHIEDLSPLVFNSLQVGEVAIEDELGPKEISRTLANSLRLYKRGVLENSARIVAKKDVSFTKMRNRSLTNFANILTQKHGFTINEARDAAANIYHKLGVDVPGMSEDVDPSDRRRILQGIMKKVTKPSGKKSK